MEGRAGDRRTLRSGAEVRAEELSPSTRWGSGVISAPTKHADVFFPSPKASLKQKLVATYTEGREGS